MQNHSKEPFKEHSFLYTTVCLCSPLVILGAQIAAICVLLQWGIHEMRGQGIKIAQRRGLPLLPCFVWLITFIKPVMPYAVLPRNVGLSQPLASTLRPRPQPCASVRPYMSADACGRVLVARNGAERVLGGDFREGIAMLVSDHSLQGTTALVVV